jgi:hypothetical protein
MRGRSGGARGTWLTRAASAEDSRSGELSRCVRCESGTNQGGIQEFHQVTVSGALDQTQDAFGSEATNGAAGGRGGERGSASKPVHGEAKARLAFQQRMAEKQRVDGAVDMEEPKRGYENIFEVLPEGSGVVFFVGHGGVFPGKVRAAERRGQAGATRTRVPRGIYLSLDLGIGNRPRTKRPGRGNGTVTEGRETTSATSAMGISQG